MAISLDDFTDRRESSASKRTYIEDQRLKKALRNARLQKRQDAYLPNVTYAGSCIIPPSKDQAAASKIYKRAIPELLKEYGELIKEEDLFLKFARMVNPLVACFGLSSINSAKALYRNIGSSDWNVERETLIGVDNWNKQEYFLQVKQDLDVIDGHVKQTKLISISSVSILFLIVLFYLLVALWKGFFVAPALILIGYMAVSGIWFVVRHDRHEIAEMQEDSAFKVREDKEFKDDEDEDLADVLNRLR